MTTELEKQFFDTFEIEPKPLFSTRNGYTDDAYYYPQITDRILLELICITQQMKNVKVLKAFTLDYLIYDYERNVERISNTGVYQEIANEIKQQVQALFKE